MFNFKIPARGAFHSSFLTSSFSFATFSHTQSIKKSKRLLPLNSLIKKKYTPHSSFDFQISNNQDYPPDATRTLNLIFTFTTQRMTRNLHLGSITCLEYACTHIHPSNGQEYNFIQ
eukprot:TRINITY_DN3591_c0_g3_i1.p1 TRINITY_DN3591_c0_g3~~TRINITY_DN3591_c0_g3_i1.p1  ORF type:complete len:116 (-),score=4.57 TRINITY_DN3591_c0_g3_i1:1763-2110(-)